jgi:hypothetical protein
MDMLATDLEDDALLFSLLPFPFAMCKSPNSSISSKQWKTCNSKQLENGGIKQVCIKQLEQICMKQLANKNALLTFFHPS